MLQLNGCLPTEGLKPSTFEWWPLCNHYGTILSYHAAAELQQLWHTCELRSAAAWLTAPHSPWGVLDGSVRATPTQRQSGIRPCEGCRAPSIRGEHLGTRSSILTCSPWASCPEFLEEPFFPSVKLIRKCNNCKCCEALNVHWQDYRHLICSSTKIEMEW